MILFLRFLLNFSFDWEDIWKTLFDLISKHLEFRQKYSATLLFSTLFLVFVNEVKRGLSSNICLLMFFTSAQTEMSIISWLAGVQNLWGRSC